MNAKKPVLICVDDEPHILRSLERVFRKEEFDVVTTNNPDSVIHIMEDCDVRVVMSDFRMEDLSGLELLKAVRKKNEKVVRIILSGYADETLITEALNNGDVQAYLLKPFDQEKLKEKIRSYF